MNYLILVVAFISITIGIFVGALIVWFIYFWRRRQIVDSLIRPEDVVGHYGTVEIPFDANSKGKVRINIKGSIVDLFAVTDEERDFNPGDRIFIIQMKDNKVWVVGEDSLNRE
jgi:membrane protein implicated in regulation of membrane protease activity